MSSLLLQVPSFSWNYNTYFQENPFPTFDFSVTLPKNINVDGVPVPVPFPLGGYTLFSVTLPDIANIPSWVAGVITSFASALTSYILAWLIWLPEEMVFLLGNVAQNAGSYIDSTIIKSTQGMIYIFQLSMKGFFNMTVGLGPLQPFVIVIFFTMFVVVIIMAVTFAIKKVVELL